MTRFLSSLMILAMAGSLTAAASASMTHMNKPRHGCAVGQTYVHGYMKGGKYVKGYCRHK
ncbi:MAG: hypothetical protein GIW97_03400 [Candidatus Eremiobacteraeota bacterium]|nr:hypothetical protein [Candidatus Eremiobacteraeota bacterium]